ncbi:DinB family protein [Deinococcus sp. HMF7604]|uniref:DinB family protein n=1 Tax=Deinococcus betulae TaxID=2873312 RepID=UPI001CC9EF2E|nr:DinB family protein [Deinococcus betulae]MBZ9750176.1 DinB family protein [Deinococcus betulae]
MNDWDDLLLTGGFAVRESIFAGLTLEQVTARPQDVPHSIYQELWHAAMVLKISLDEGRAVLEHWPYAHHFPPDPSPASQAEWDDLVALFMLYSRRAVTQAKDERWLTAPEPGYPHTQWRDGLEFLAVHTAYHLGKIVSLRQVMHIWP